MHNGEMEATGLKRSFKGIMGKKMEATMLKKELYRDNGKESGSYHIKKGAL